MPIDINIDYSIIICSYNPDERILKRCLTAISNLNFNNINYEIILVDNNSTHPLNTFSYVQDFLKTPHTQYIIAYEQGLTHARMKGIEAANGTHIVFFDDDNEPQNDYLLSLKVLHSRHPGVGAWGPGNIWVDFIDGIDRSIGVRTEEYARAVFQERHEAYDTYANIRKWQNFYPYGTGLCIRSDFLREYVANTKAGKYTATGRKGNALSSGEDLQMVLFCINKSAAAGVSPTLKVNHLIPRKRANFEYLKKIIFGTNISYHRCIAEILEEYQVFLQKDYIKPIRFQKKVLINYIKILFSKNQVKKLELIRFIGLHAGHYIAINKPIPESVMWILNSLGIDTKKLPI